MKANIPYFPNEYNMYFYIISILSSRNINYSSVKNVIFSLQTLVAAVIFATVIVYLKTAYSSLGQFIAVYVIMATLSLLLLQSVFGENPVLWFLDFVSGSCTKVTYI